MTSRQKGLLRFFFVYLLTFAIGILGFSLTKNWIPSLFVRLLAADVLATLFVFAIGMFVKNPSLYDPYWSILPPFFVILWMMSYHLFSSVFAWLFLFCVFIWSIRLTVNFIINYDDIDYIDWRYVMLKKQFPKLWFVTNLFGIHLMPTMIVLVQFATMTRIVSDTPLSIYSIVGVLVMVLAAWIELIADHQMKRFREEHIDHKSVMTQGLWSVSRHPNYFGEVLFWWGVFLFFRGTSPAMLSDWIFPILMTSLFLFISIPMMEKKIVSSRPHYAQIQKEISSFLPIPKKKAS